MNNRIVVVVVNMGDGKYQSQLRSASGSNHLFFSRRETSSAKAKRAAAQLFEPISLEWTEPVPSLKSAEPNVLQVAYVNLKL